MASRTPQPGDFFVSPDDYEDLKELTRGMTQVFELIGPEMPTRGPWELDDITERLAVILRTYRNQEETIARYATWFLAFAAALISNGFISEGAEAEEVAEAVRRLVGQRNALLGPARQIRDLAYTEGAWEGPVSGAMVALCTAVDLVERSDAKGA